MYISPTIMSTNFICI